MCHSDAGIFPFRDIAEGGQGMAGRRLEFEGSRTCRSFEAVKKWNEEHSVNRG